MNTSLSWIKAYVPDLECTAQEYADAMTLSGSKVEGFERLDENLEKIVVAKVLSVAQHPDADKLVVCQMQIGAEETVQIVTGAPNVFEGALIPVVLDGGRVATDHDGKKVEGGTKIKKGKLRGVESFGMMCSIQELGSSKEFYPEAAEDGVYIFDPEMYPDVKPGDSAVEALGLNDVNFEYEITSNRVDCFGVIGIAREAAATFGKKFCPPVVTETGNSEKASDYIDVEVQATDLCSRYIARVVKDIKLAPSPLWMQRRRASTGVRPLANIAPSAAPTVNPQLRDFFSYTAKEIADLCGESAPVIVLNPPYGKRLDFDAPKLYTQIGKKLAELARELAPLGKQLTVAILAPKDDSRPGSKYTCTANLLHECPALDPQQNSDAKNIVTSHGGLSLNAIIARI